MPDAVPCRDEIVAGGEHKGADIRVMKGDTRMFRPRQGDHLRGQVEALDFKAAMKQKLNDSSAAAATDIERPATLRGESDRSLMLGDATLRIEFGTRPMRRKFVVTGRSILGKHADLNAADWRLLV